jgi:hypothetical protein
MDIKDSDLQQIYICLNKKIDKKDIVINTLLVLAGIRPAFMIQPIDYYDRNDVKDYVEKMITAIIVCCRDYIEFRHIDQGSLIYNKHLVNTRYRDQFRDINKDNIHLGQILGYECAGNISHHYSVQVYVANKDTKIDLYAMSCSDNNSDNNNRLSDKIQKINDLLKRIKFPYTAMYSIEEGSVIIKPRVVENLNTNQKFSEIEINELKNELLNMGFYQTERIIEEYADIIYREPFKTYIKTYYHYVQNSPVSLCFPLSQDDANKMNKMIEKWENDTIMREDIPLDLL